MSQFPSVWWVAVGGETEMSLFNLSFEPENQDWEVNNWPQIAPNMELKKHKNHKNPGWNRLMRELSG